MVSWKPKHMPPCLLLCFSLSLPSPGSPQTWIWDSFLGIAFVPLVGAWSIHLSLSETSEKSDPNVSSLGIPGASPVGTWDYSWLCPSMYCPPISIQAWLLVIDPWPNPCCYHISLSQGGQGSCLLKIVRCAGPTLLSCLSSACAPCS